ncbi:MAG: FkbM family methyltransferase [Verrucomicrobia bacterium]|nr:FkbM family methyltransferase [Verrucomicrobiota bacterium]
MKFRDAVKLLFSPRDLLARRELERVRKLPRYTPGRTTFLGRPLEYLDSSSYYFLHEEIFKEEVYAFSSLNSSPRIIDGGSNIGLSVIYFKKLFPASRISAYEADPRIAEVLKRNLLYQGITDVEVRAEALWSCETELSFQCEGADGGKLVKSMEKSIRVPAVGISDLLCETVDFLKLDIEGAEIEVLESCQPCLKNVEMIFVEYHSIAEQTQRLPDLLNLLRESGFRFFISAPSVFSGKPFLQTETYCGFDMVLNIHCVRSDKK